MIRWRSRKPRAGRAAPLVPLVLPGLWGAVAVTWKLTCPLAQREDLVTRIASSVVFFAVGTALVIGVIRGLRRELRQIKAVAHAAQQVLLRPLPPCLDGLSLAATQLSSVRGAAVGGDLYEVVATPYGVRVIIGDVRGHGLAAFGAVAAVLGSFREAAHEEPGLGGVLRRLDRALQRYVGERARDECAHGPGANPSAEEFVTVLLLDVRRNGDLMVLNCGHPWPYRLGYGAERLSAGDPLPPLGAFPLPDTLPVQRCARLLPCEALLLHTDGAEEARDAAGRFFPLEEVLVRAARSAPHRAPAAVVEQVRTSLLAHTRGRLADDVALVAVRNDRARTSCTRLPAQSAEHGLRRSRPAPSSR
ncbi:serine/threonine-protein phosphatase [Streptomyces sp. MUM 203J]|uniref:PP2C family protein-serine/threonine phosphatase n=1 Tax=Streptomyces sp. MUM 203J TaxID=2791990 RepID=UPI001F049AB0|nr:PP2C family protein-serine/threonine phosphatase [Streptomyces sp. MUM 203J]MCH0543000.1 serine/threonine-protein phosphatase [Streptomyces sp. MUM 203J]